MEFHYRQMHTISIPYFADGWLCCFWYFSVTRLAVNIPEHFPRHVSKFLYDINLGITCWVMDFCALHFTKCCHFLSKSANIFIISNENSHFSTTCQPLVLLSFQWKKVNGYENMFCCLRHISLITIYIEQHLYDDRPF